MSSSNLTCLDRLLNKTTLTVQRVTHKHILERGQTAFIQTASEESYDKDKAVKHALEQAEIRFARELKCALSKIRVQKDGERTSALKSQKEHYEKHIARVAEQRDALEEERVRELRRQFDIEKELTLNEQESRHEIAMRQAVQLARKEESDSIRVSLMEQHQREVTEAIKRCEEENRIILKQAVQNMKAMCNEENQKSMKLLLMRHSKEVYSLNEKYDLLFDQLERYLKYNRQLEKDYQLLQHEYKRFIDNSDGYFHSDYMLQMREHRVRLAREGLPAVEVEDISDLKRILKEC